MADLSGRTPIYVRTTGNDTTGNGSLSTPFATPQRAFEAAYWDANAKPHLGLTTITVDVQDDVYVVEGTFYAANAAACSFEADASTSGGLSNLAFAVVIASAIKAACSVAVEIEGIVGGEAAPATIYIRNKEFDTGTNRTPPSITAGGVSATLAYTTSTIDPVVDTASYVLDLGAGTFGGVNLYDAHATEWPSRIAVRGAGKTSSLLGGVNASSRDVLAVDVGGYNYVVLLDTVPPCEVAIVSNKTVNLGDVTAHGGYVSDTWGGITGVTPRQGENITLTDCVAGDLSNGGTYGHYEAPGAGAANYPGSGTVTLTGCEAGDITTTSYGGLWSYTGLNGSGSVTVTGSTVGDITTQAVGSDSNQYYFGSSGHVTVTNSAVGNINAQIGASAGYGGNAALPVGDGGDVTVTSSTVGNNLTGEPSAVVSWNNKADGGNVTVSSSTVGNINTVGTDTENQNGIVPSHSGDVTISNSVTGNIAANGGADGGTGALGIGGVVELVGNVPLPGIILCGELDTTALDKGRGVNGSSILGVV